MKDVDDDALRALDPARAPDPEAHLQPTARAMLERVLTAQEVTPEILRAVAAPTPRRRRAPVRVAAILGAAAVVAGAVVVLPNLGESASAWTAVPQAVSDERALDAAEWCRRMFDGPAPEGGSTPNAEELAAMAPVLAERRGRHDLVVIGGGGWTAQCLVDETGGGAGALAPPNLAPSPADPDDVVLLSSMVLLEDDGYVVAIFGAAGADVMALTLHPEGVEPVTATVASGCFAGFWPAPDARSDTPEGMRATLVLRSGEVRDVALEWVDVRAGEDA